MNLDFISRNVSFENPKVTLNYYSAKEKKYKETIVFVHHYGGNADSMIAHCRFGNQLGFDCVSFSMSHNDRSRVNINILSKNRRLGIRHIWADEISDVLNQVEGPKIVFSQSQPSLTAIDAIARLNFRGIKALVCDGGPFYRVPRMSWNLYTHAYPINNRLLRLGASTLGPLIWGYKDLKKDTTKNLNRFPDNFPVLSIRCWNDKLVPVAAIDEVFQPHKQLDFTTLAIPEAGHLKGLFEDPENYKAKLGKFLKAHASAL